MSEPEEVTVYRAACAALRLVALRAVEAHNRLVGDWGRRYGNAADQVFLFDSEGPPPLPLKEDDDGRSD